MKKILISLTFLWASLYSVQAADDGFRLRKDVPIEINADQLTVDDNKKTASFVGNVHVVQDNLNLKASRLVVFYEKNSQNSAANSGDGVTNGAVSALRAEGQVLLTTGKETAKSDWAYYNVPKKNITLGDDVTLLQNKNMIKGKHLTVDLQTGITTMTGQSAGASGRVKTIINPSTKK